jgi:hypothetical protein
VDAIEWLLDSEPAIRWQAMRDLTAAPAETVSAERARVAREGLGAEILARQDRDGAWRREGEKRTWLTTLFTMLLLRATGVDPGDAAVVSAVRRAETNLRWSDHDGWNLRSPEYGGNAFFDGEEEPCINGGVLALSGYFGRPSETLARRLLSEQLGDGGWNCEAPKSQAASFHTTICVLEGLLEYERAIGGDAEIATARKRGEEYLLARSLFRRRSTGDVASAEFLELAFPPRYHYDILRALDYFRASGARPDERMNQAIQILQSKQEASGRWTLEACYDEALAVQTGETLHDPSRWNTLRALRVLKWWGTRPPRA